MSDLPARYPAPPGDPGSPSGPTVLGNDDCWSHLREVPVGRLAYVVDGWPVVVPVNFVVDGDTIALRSDSGGKQNAATRAAQVSLQVDDVDRLYRCGWSVLVFGVAQQVDDPAERTRLEALGLRSWAVGSEHPWIRIHPVRITGRALPRAWRYPASPE